MSNGRFSFEIDKVNYTLHFGMRATEIFSQKGIKEAILIQERGEKKAGDIKALACIVYSGLCNYADIVEEQYPTFEEAYLLTEEILFQDKKLQENIYKSWIESRPTIQMFERLGINISIEQPEKKKKPTGKK